MRTIVVHVRRPPIILLIAAFAALGTGLLEDLHQRTHLMQHAAAAKAGTEPAGHDRGDGDGCELCVSLHLARVSTGWVPVMVCLGVFVAFLTQLAPQWASQRVAVWIDCRGPPVL
jgi:hypothetical protein